MEISATRPPVRGATPAMVFLVFALVLMRSPAILTKAIGSAIVTWCALHLLKQGVFRD